MAPQTLADLVAHVEATEIETAELYGPLAPLYEFVVEHRGVPQTQFGTVRATLPDDAASVLELACGTGGLLAELEAQYETVVGLDRSRQLLALARRKTDAELVQGDVRRPALGDDRFDAAVMLGHALGHLTGEGDVQQCLDAVARSLAPGGYVFFDFHERAAYAEPRTETNVADGDRFRVTHESDLGAADETGLVERTDEFSIRDREADRTATVGTEPYAFRAHDPESVRERVQAADLAVVDARSRDDAGYVLARRR